MIKREKENFVQRYSDVIGIIDRDGYDCAAAKHLEQVLKRQHNYNLNTERKILLRTFVRIYIRLQSDKHFEKKEKKIDIEKVKSSLPPPAKIVLNRETLINRDLIEKRCLDFIRNNGISRESLI